MRPMWAGFPITVMPTGADVGIAHAIARNTKPGPEEIARGLTWGADEKVAAWSGRGSDGWSLDTGASPSVGPATMNYSSPSRRRCCRTY